MLDLVKDKKDFPWIIMEKCDYSLQDMIKKNKEVLIPDYQVIKIFTMICLGLYDIHEKKIVHRDLKPANILCKKMRTQELFKIADFGTSFKPENGAETTVKEYMTSLYVPIE
jgi:eukaryotic-like serine/threonine-protein kinase